MKDHTSHCVTTLSNCYNERVYVYCCGGVGRWLTELSKLRMRYSELCIQYLRSIPAMIRQFV